MMRPLGPGMMQQIQQPCSHCKQTGYAPPAHDLCADCGGKVILNTQAFSHETQENQMLCPEAHLERAAPRAFPSSR